ncbi:hypothetical protein [Streptomyces sp. NBC_01565]|uniref:hypothetical protein n=1 Tax=unclassified Streptomyces TaxID=2593676 RepID=UPI00225BA2BB|nr:hypothetical protein [Streptomyces sp. NBC_01565]MCX4545622.1 hypothetical protein [Streptomyces sp. NBC_01565]
MRGTWAVPGALGVVVRSGAVLAAVGLVCRVLYGAIELEPAEAALDAGPAALAVSLLRVLSVGALGAASSLALAALLMVFLRACRLVSRRGQGRRA